MFITKNGYGDLVVMSIEAYEEMLETAGADAAIAEELDAVWMLEEADLSDLSGPEIIELVNSAIAVVDKQAFSYSSKLNDLAADAMGLVNAANEWWSFLTVTMKGQAPYIGAIRLTNDCTYVRFLRSAIDNVLCWVILLNLLFSLLLYGIV